MSSYYNRVPATGNTVVPNALTTILTLKQRWLHGQDGWGGWLIHLMNGGARDLTDLQFRFSMDEGVTWDKYYGISDTVADAIAAKLLAGEHVTVLLPIPTGQLRIQARTAFADGAMHVKYVRYDFPFDKIRIDGMDIDTFASSIVTSATNGSDLAVDNTDAITYIIPITCKGVRIQNIGDEDIHFAYGQNTAAGTRGGCLSRCPDDGAGALVLGAGGELVETEFKGTMYFYCVGTSTLRVTRLNS